MVRREGSFLIFKCDNCGREEIWKLSRGSTLIKISDNVKVFDTNANEEKQEDKKEDKGFLGGLLDINLPF
jgi:hypothetical protein